MNGTHCLNCNKDIGFFAIMKAGLPTKIKCPHCGTRLIYSRIPWIQSIVSLILYIIILVIAFSLTSEIEIFNGITGAIVKIFLIFLLWQPFEFYLAKYLRTHCELILKEKDKRTQNNKMTLSKSIIKYIPFVRKTLIFSLIVVIVLPLVAINAMEYLQPKKIFIDDIAIEAPTGMRLYSASVDHEEIQKPYSPLLFQNTYQYTFPELSGSMFWFQAINNSAEAVTLSVFIDINTWAKTDDEAKDKFRKYISSHKKNEGYKGVESKECFGYTERLNKEFHTAHVFHHKKVVNITIASDKDTIVKKVLHQFCTDIPIEG